MSHTLLTYHLIFGTFRRIQAIHQDHELELYKFIYDFATARGVFVRRIGGMPDHIHLLCDIPAKISLAEFVKMIKTESSKFLRVNPHFPIWEKWAAGYGAFTVDKSTCEARKLYIQRQKEHHAHLSFADEYRDFLIQHGFSATTPLLGDDEAGDTIAE